MSKEGDAHNALTAKYSQWAFNPTGFRASPDYAAAKKKYGNYVDTWLAANQEMAARTQAERSAQQISQMLQQQYQQQVAQQQKLEPLFLEQAGYRQDPATGQYVRTEEYQQELAAYRQQQEALNQLLQRQIASAQQQGDYSRRYMEELFPQLQEQQRTMSERQQKEYERAALLEPFLLEDMGLVGQYDPQGRLTGYSKRPKTEQELLEEQLYTEALGKYKKAMAGELEPSPVLTRGLQEEEAALQEQMRRNLGPGWETSTPGIETMAEWGRRRQEVLDQARRGELDTYSQIAMAQGGGLSGQRTEAANRRMQGTQSYQANTMGDLATMLGLSPSYSAALQGQGTLSDLFGASLSQPMAVSNYGNLDVSNLLGSQNALMNYWGDRYNLDKQLWARPKQKKQGTDWGAIAGKAVGTAIGLMI